MVLNISHSRSSGGSEYHLPPEKSRSNISTFRNHHHWCGQTTRILGWYLLPAGLMSIKDESCRAVVHGVRVSFHTEAAWKSISPRLSGILQ